MKKKSVTYKEIRKITSDPELTYKKKKDKFEGMFRRIVMEILNESEKNPMETRRKRNRFDHRLIDVGRAIEAIASVNH